MVRDTFIFLLILLTVIGGISSVLSMPLLEALAAAVIILGSAWLFLTEPTAGRLILISSMLILILTSILRLSAWFWLGIAILLYLLLIIPHQQTLQKQKHPVSTRPSKKTAQNVTGRRKTTLRLPPEEKPRKTRQKRQRKDDLTLIRGIGPRLATALQRAGIKTYKQLANASVAELERIARKAGVRAPKPADWQRQAVLAAEGKWNELRSLQKATRAKRKTKA